MSSSEYVVQGALLLVATFCLIGLLALIQEWLRLHNEDRGGGPSGGVK